MFDAIRSGNERLAESIAYTHIEKGRVPSLELVSAGEAGSEAS